MPASGAEHVVMSLDDIENLAFRALVAAGASEAAARPVARATAAHEAMGVSSHGLVYVPIYCQHVECGKVRGRAVPQVERPRPGAIRVDAGEGFAHPAIDAGMPLLVEAAKTLGVAVLTLHNSYNCGVLGYHTGRLAGQGLVALGFTNAPASMAPAGGHRPLFGTNPFSVAAPGPQGRAEVVIDQSASVIAKSEISRHAATGTPIPEGWALDADGRPTTDPAAALAGSMVPAGGYKGAGIALMVELMAACLSGATLGMKASPFSGIVGGPPRTGQAFLAIDPEAASGGAFADRLAMLCAAIREQAGARVPGDGRQAAWETARTQGVAVPLAVVDKINAWL